MSQIVESHFDRPDEAVELLKKSLHGGFVSDEELKDGERELCESFGWFESAVKFRCDCGEWHTARDRESPYECPVHMRPVEPDSVRNGFRMETDTSLSLDVDIDYELEIVESPSIVSISEFDDKAIVFAPDVDSLEFPDRVGRVVWLPLQSLPDIVNEEDRENIVSEIEEKRKKFDRLG